MAINIRGLSETAQSSEDILNSISQGLGQEWSLTAGSVKDSRHVEISGVMPDTTKLETIQNVVTDVLSKTGHKVDSIELPDRAKTVAEIVDYQRRSMTFYIH